MKQRLRTIGTTEAARWPKRTTLLSLLWSLPPSLSGSELERAVRKRLASGEVVLTGLLRDERFWEDEGGLTE